MKKEDLKITLDELNTIIPIFAHEFCDENVGENDKVKSTDGSFDRWTGSNVWTTCHRQCIR